MTCGTSEVEAASTFEEGEVLTWGTSEAEFAGIFEEDGMSEESADVLGRR